MAEFELSHAVAGLSHHVSATSTLWGIYAAATFTASGFGISMGNRFTCDIALYLSIGFIAFTFGHWRLIRSAVRTHREIAADILSHLDDPQRAPTSYVQSVRAMCQAPNRIWAHATAHVVIDICVLVIIWRTVAGPCGI